MMFQVTCKTLGGFCRVGKKNCGTNDFKQKKSIRHEAVIDCQCRVSRSGVEGLSWADQLENT